MMYTDIRTDEIMFGIYLLNICDAFSDIVFYNGGFLCIRIVEI